MVAENQQKLYTAVSFNESKSSLMYVKLTHAQLSIFFPQYVIRILSVECEFKNQTDIKFRKFSFSRMTIDSTDCLVVELTFDQFNHFLTGSSFRVFTLTRKTQLTIIHNNSETLSLVSVLDPQPQIDIVHTSNNTNKTSTNFDNFSDYRSNMTISNTHDNYSSISYSIIDIFPVRSYLITRA